MSRGHVELEAPPPLHVAGFWGPRAPSGHRCWKSERPRPGVGRGRGPAGGEGELQLPGCGEGRGSPGWAGAPLGLRSNPPPGRSRSAAWPPVSGVQPPFCAVSGGKPHPLGPACPRPPEPREARSHGGQKRPCTQTPQTAHRGAGSPSSTPPTRPAGGPEPSHLQGPAGSWGCGQAAGWRPQTRECHRGLRLLWKRRPSSPGCDPVFTPLGPQPPVQLLQAWPCLASRSSPPTSPAAWAALSCLLSSKSLPDRACGVPGAPKPRPGPRPSAPVRFLPPFALCLVASLRGGSPNPRRASAPEPGAGTCVWEAKEGGGGGGGQHPSQAPSQAASRWAHGDPRAGLWSVCGAPCPRPRLWLWRGRGAERSPHPREEGSRRFGECHCPGAPWRAAGLVAEPTHLVRLPD